MTRSKRYAERRTPRGFKKMWAQSILCLMLGLFGAIGCGSPEGDAGTPLGGGGSSGGLEGYAIAAKIDPHVQALADSITANGEDITTWAGEQLLPEDYQGALRAPSGVMAGLMGNDLDRCLFVHHLLSAAGVASRFAIDGEDCGIEAVVNGQSVRVPTSRFDTEPIAEGATRVIEIPESMCHKVELLERVFVVGPDSGQTIPEERTLGTMALSTLSSSLLAVDYVVRGSETHLRVRIGDADSPDPLEWLGRSLEGASRQDLIIRHIAPNGATANHRRTLFDAASAVVNQAPDIETDLYSIWIGAHVVSSLFHDLESRRFDPANDLAAALRLRSIELAMETDNAAWQLFTDHDQDGAVFFDSVRVIISSREKRFRDRDEVTPSLDLLANPRRILGNSDPAAMQVALGMTDAMVESMFFQRATGLSALSVPDIFAALFQEEPNDEVSRSEFYDDALERLLLEGVTEESLTFGDDDSPAKVRVVLISGNLVLDLSDDERDRLESTAGSIFTALITPSGDVVLENGPDRGWPIQLYLLENGAQLDYLPTIVHGESPQSALATPTGTAIEGQGTYQNANITYHAVARAFEALQDPGDPDSRRDVADWHVADETGVVTSSGSMDRATATLTESKPRVLQWGAARDTTSFYESPLWLAPAIAASIRDRMPLECRLVYDGEGVTRWHDVDFTQFTPSRMTIEIDGTPVGISTIIASDDTGVHEITIAQRDVTRLVLQMKTPNGEAKVTAITTPRELRLRGRMMSYRGSPEVKQQQSYAIGIPHADIATLGSIGTSWPDGSVDLRVPGTANPTLPASVAILVDTSSSMDQPVDFGCVGDGCPIRIDVVADALDDIVANTSNRVELAVWGFPSTFDDICRREINDLAPWSLDRDSTLVARGRLTVAGLTGGTPLTGVVNAAIDDIDDNSRGAARRLILLADGDNDCDPGLESVVVPDDLVIYTIGIGIAAGGDAEQQLQSLATRTGGTYTRTTTGDELTTALVSLGTLPIPVPVSPRTVATTITAPNHLAKIFQFAVDTDDVIIYLDEEPQREPLAAFVAVFPGEAFPTDKVAIADEYVSRMQENRAEQENVLLVMPNKMVNVGLFQDAFGWYEINTETGATTAVGQDGLHVAAGVIGFGGTVAGLWAGVDGVMEGFSGCVIPGCGSDLESITANICGPIQSNASVWSTIYLNFIGQLLNSVEGFVLAESFLAGATLVEAACAGGINAVGLAQSSAGNVSATLVGAAAGAVIGWGYGTILGIILDPDIVTGGSKPIPNATPGRLSR
ncbi:MAG: hypothetical protein IID38_05660 [Planctomycetes bacterium]|nr:hypothetical protein [Planctomycetota bacterium]